MSVETVLVTGASGFVGRAVVARLTNLPEPARLRLLVHRRRPAYASSAMIEHVRGDLASALPARITNGVSTVLHLASLVSEDPVRCDAVNAHGTERLVVAARAAGVERLVYVSTAAVYGYAVHAEATEDEVQVAPATPISRSRAAAERIVLDAGGVVLRPLFIYGVGDTKFVPVVAKALRAVPFLIDGGRARLSVIEVGDLADAICGMTRLSDDRWPGGAALHVTDGHAVSFRDLASTIAEALGFDVPRHSIPYAAARILLFSRRHLFGKAAGAASARHRLFLIARDHSYDSTRLWTLLGRSPGPALAERFDACANWYAQILDGNMAHAS